MKTIALRFGEMFSPDCGTIQAHQKVINELGYVWYGKMGTQVSKHIANELLKQENTKILLVNSGKTDRYWAYVDDITNEVPRLEEIPEYYRYMADRFKTWFKVSRFEATPKDIMSKCFVVSSGNPLGEVSKHSMSPYFIIEHKKR